MTTSRNSDTTREFAQGARGTGKLTLIVPLMSLGALSLVANAAVSESSTEPQSTSGQSTSGGSGTHPAAAEGPVLQEVVVTAQKREQNLQNVPIAITALSGDQLAQRGVANTLDIASVSPGVVTSTFGENGTSPAIYIRGVGQLDFSPHQESPTAMYVDDAYVGFIGATYLGLYDTKQFSVLRGPQGTLFGRNATAGVIQITTNDPTDHLTGYLQQTGGSFSQTTTEGAISGPLSDKLDARLAFLYNRNTGWLNNNNGPSAGGTKTGNMRLKFLYKANDDTRNLLEFFYSRALPMATGAYLDKPAAPNPANHGLAENTNGPLFTQFCNGLGFPTPPPGAGNCQGWVPPNGNPFDLTFQYYDPREGHSDSSLWGFTDKFTHKMSWAEFTSITNYASYGMSYIDEDSGNPFPIIGYGESANAWQGSEEARLNGETSSLHWVVGLYALHIRGHYTNVTPVYTGIAPLPPPTGNFSYYNRFSNIYDYSILTGSQFPQGVWTEALFAQTDYALSDRWSVTVGGRLERDSKWADMTQFCDVVIPVTNCAANFLITDSQFTHGNVSQTEWSGNLTFNYQLDPDMLLYAGVRRGTKGAEIDANTYPGTPGLTFSSIYVQPEALTDVEGGFKSELFDHRLRLNADAFYYIYHNYQAEKFVNFADLTFNADARDYGGELSADALITPTVTASVGLAYLHTKVQNVQLPDLTYADQVQPLAPTFSLTADLRKEWREPFGTFFAAGNLTYVGSRYFGSVNQPELLGPSYAMGNLSAGYNTPGGKLGFTLTVKNITNKVILEDAFDVTSSGGYTEYNIAPPRWYSLAVRYNF
jgi:iron complex outermembrane receptor protein